MATHKPSIVVVGGGMGGVETAASLANQIDDEARIILVSESPELALRPFFIYPRSAICSRTAGAPTSTSASRPPVAASSSRSGGSEISISRRNRFVATVTPLATITW